MRRPARIWRVLMRCAPAWAQLLLLAQTGLSATTGEGEEPTVVTVGRLAALNDGPGKLRGEVHCRLSSSPVLMVDGRTVVLKVDWHFVDGSAVRTTDATVSAEATAFPCAGGTPVKARDSRRLSSGTMPKAQVRDASAMELTLSLPPGVALWRCELGLRVLCASKLRKQDSGLQRFPAIIVCRDAYPEALGVGIVQGIAVSYGHVCALEGEWTAELREKWLAAETGPLVPSCSTVSGDSAADRASPSPGSARNAIRSLAQLRLPGEAPTLAARLQQAGTALRECAAGTEGHVREQLRQTACAMETLASEVDKPTAVPPPQAAPEVRDRRAEPQGPTPEPPAVSSLVNGNFADGLRAWERLGDAKERGGPVEVEVVTPEPRGTRALRLVRESGGVTLGWGGVGQSVSIPVPEGAIMHLAGQVRVGRHAPAGGGSLGAAFPLRLVVRYEDQCGQSQTYSHAFYCLGQALSAPSVTKVAPDEWHPFRSPPLAGWKPRPARVTRIEIHACGRTFDSQVRGVSLE